MLKQKIIDELKNKKVLILGFGREGRSTYNFIQNNNINCTVAIADKNEIVDEEIINSNIKLHTGEKYLDSMVEYDVVMKSPGISLKDIDYSKLENKITSQTELFLKYASEKTIGITGTKGKSTTSSLIYNMLKTEYNVILVGNIGRPVFEEIDKYSDMDYYVFELSSHQLEHVKYSPHISVLLNMYEEHLDHYNSYEEYKEAKRNIFKHQKETDYLIYNQDMKDIILGDYILKQNILDISKIDFKIESNLIGKHNEYNVNVSATIAILLGIDKLNILKGAREFKGLPHRLEYVGKYKDIHFVDDSIATIPEAAISAIESLENVGTVILGGMDRGIDYTRLIEYLNDSSLDNIVLMNDSGKKIYDKLNKANIKNNIVLVNDLEEAVKYAIEHTRKNMTCLLSPAAASYGIFKNFEERGDKFKEYIIKYTK